MKFINFTTFLFVITIYSSLWSGVTPAKAQQAPASEPSPGLLEPPLPTTAVEEPALPTDATGEPPQPTILEDELPLDSDEAPTKSKTAPPPMEDASMQSITQDVAQPLLDEIESKPAGAAEDSPIAEGSDTGGPKLPPIMSEKKQFQFSVDAKAIYDDNVNYATKDPLSDLILVASPRFAMNLGDYIAKDESYLILNYNPEAIYFMNDTADSSLDQNVRSQLQYAISKLAIQADGSYQHLSGATPDLGERAERDLASLKATVKYGFGARVEAETSFLYSTADYDLAQFADYSEYINELLIRYQLSARTKIAVGGGIGRLEIDTYGAQDFQRAIVEAIYEATDKFSLKLKGGLDFRDLEGQSETMPILAINGEYRFTEQTSFGINIYRDINASGGSPGSTYTRTGIVASVRHKFGEKFTGEVAVGYERSEYSSSKNGPEGQAARRDDSFYFRPSLTYQLREDRRLQIYYMHRTNESATGDFGFEGNQIGVSAGIDF